MSDLLMSRKKKAKECFFFSLSMDADKMDFIYNYCNVSIIK